MAGIRKNEKIVKCPLNKLQRTKLAREITLDKFKDLTIGGIVKVLNKGFSRKVRRSRAEVLLGTGVILEGKDIRCLLEH